VLVHKPPKVIALAAAGLAWVAMLPSAAANPKTPPSSKPPSTLQVINACARTTGCWFEGNATSGGTGCSPTVCFHCGTDSCTPIKAVKGGQHPVGHLPVGQTDGVKAILRATQVGHGATQLRTGASVTRSTGPVLHGGYTNPTGPTASTTVVHRQH
jgi:hypothetical protein